MAGRLPRAQYEIPKVDPIDEETLDAESLNKFINQPIPKQTVLSANIVQDD